MMNKNSNNKCEVDVGGKGEMQSFVMVNERYFGQEYTMCSRYSSDNSNSNRNRNNVSKSNNNEDRRQIRHVVVKPVLKESSLEDNINTTDK